MPVIEAEEALLWSTIFGSVSGTVMDEKDRKSLKNKWLSVIKEFKNEGKEPEPRTLMSLMGPGIGIG